MCGEVCVVCVVVCGSLLQCVVVCGNIWYCVLVCGGLCGSVW